MRQRPLGQAYVLILAWIVIRLLGIFVENRRSKSRRSFRNGSIERGEAAILGKNG
jgi:hypothetical protein